MSSPMCRICHAGEECGKLQTFCLCTGTTGFQHANCLSRWININVQRTQTPKCEICQFKYEIALRRIPFRFAWLVSKEVLDQGFRHALVVVAGFALLSIFYAIIATISASDKERDVYTGSAIYFLVMCSFFFCFCVVIPMFVSWQRRSRQLVAVPNDPELAKKAPVPVPNAEGDTLVKPKVNETAIN